MTESELTRPDPRVPQSQLVPEGFSRNVRSCGMYQPCYYAECLILCLLPQSDLQTAIKTQDIPRIKQMIAEGVDPNEPLQVRITDASVWTSVDRDVTLLHCC